MLGAGNTAGLGKLCVEVSKTVCKMPWCSAVAPYLSRVNGSVETRRTKSNASSRPRNFATTDSHCNNTTDCCCYYYTAQHNHCTRTLSDMADMTEDVPMDTQDIEHETPPEDVFMAPSVHRTDELAGKSYSHFSDIPRLIADDMSKEVVLGVDEAGRGPVLGTLRRTSSRQHRD
jgi:hypothetical protein